MEILFEALGELFFELFFMMAKSKRISLWIRILIIILLVSFYSFLIISIFIIGLKALKSNLILGIFLILASLLNLIGFLVMILRKQKEI